MKIAVCISGICRGNVSKNIKLMKHHFPFDYFYATWKGMENDVKNYSFSDEVYYFDEPKMHYHPMMDTVTNLKIPKYWTLRKKMLNGSLKNLSKKTFHHTKQILIHNYLLREIPEDYDMIIRMRYDTLLSKKVNFETLLSESYNQKTAIGFGTRKSRHKDFNLMKEVPKIYPEFNPKKDVSQDWGWYLMDPLIFHRRDMFNHELVEKLHKEKKLLPAEYGWYQILSEPYGDSHRSFYGGCQIERYL